MDTLQQGIAAYKAGKRDEARRLFIQAMKENPKNEQVWGWLYQVASNDQERIQALNKVMEINPLNTQAKALLDKLTAPPLTPAAPTPVESKKPASNLKLILFAGISVMLVFCCLFALVNMDTSSAPSTLGGVSSAGTNVRYLVNGSVSTANITYMNETGGMEQVTVSLPFQYDMSVGAGAALSIVAQMDGAGSITCEIWVNSERVKESTSTMEYGIVTCADWVIR